MAFFVMRHSLFGRRFGLSSTGGLLTTPTTSGSTEFDQVAVMRDSTGAVRSPHDEPVVTTTTTGTELAFGGIHVLNSTTVNPVYTITAPRPGQQMEIYFISTLSTTLTFGGTSTAVVFAKMGGVSAGSTVLTFDNAAPHGNGLFLRGLTASKFGVIYLSSAAWT